MGGSGLARAESVCELRTGARPQPDAADRYAFDLPPLDVAILAVGTREFVQERLAAHQAIPAAVREMPVYE